MPEWAGWLGLVFGATSVYQFFRDWVNRKALKREAGHLQALGQSLAHLRAMCSEAINSGEVIKSDASKQFVRQIAYSLLTAESQVKAIEDGISGVKKD